MNSKRADYVLLSYFIILLVFGLIMLTSASTVIGYERFADRYFFIKRQLLFGVLPGLAAFFFFSRIQYAMLKKLALPMFVGSLMLLFLVFIPGIGSSLNTGAQSWIVIGGFSFQPAEFAKLAMIVYLAAYLGRAGTNLKDFTQGFLVALGIGLIPVFLVVAQPDIGTASILFAILFGLLFVAEACWSHLFGLTGVSIAGLMVMILKAPYRAARLKTFLDPETADQLGIGYHINQASIAIGSGGLFGLGLGHSRQKFEYLPEVHADSIFAIIGEEMGFIFAAGFLLLLILITFRALKIAKGADDRFGRLLIAGIILWFMVQSFFNIGAMVGLMPLTGVPLPFVSHGGTALMIAMGAVGILMNVSKHAKE